MRIGIPFCKWPAEAGGGFTFQDEIIKGILHFAKESNHTFVFLGWEKEAPLEIQLSEHVEFVSFHMHQSMSQRFYQKVMRVAKKIVAFGKRNKSKRIRTAYEEHIQNTIQNSQIDITWSPTLSCLQDIPCIITVWDLQHRNQPYFPEVSNGNEWQEREQNLSRLLRQAAHILVGTQVGKSEVEKFYQIPSERISVLPFPPPEFTLVAANLLDSSSILSKFSLPSNYLLYPAQFWPHKNHVNLLKAIRHLKEKDELILPVVFTGADKGNRCYVEKVVADLGLEDQVHFLGFVSQEELVALYQKAFALTYVTFFGPDNLPPLEAFSVGCPVIASEVAGAIEQLGDAVILVDPKNPEHIALAIKQLWDNPGLREQLIQRGYERSCKWTVKDYVKDLFSIFDEFEKIRQCWEKGMSYKLR
ncbi:glycosyltransferase family 1 protein [Leptolyngbya sp. ST-U4]|uniref:glycosyltransferase family 4 protein n=1 Tax=Leptolyngbya sp. ST-U4 TaxID=2933912 RepID=UPI00329766A3